MVKSSIIQILIPVLSKRKTNRPADHQEPVISGEPIVVDPIPRILHPLPVAPDFADRRLLENLCPDLFR